MTLPRSRLSTTFTRIFRQSVAWTPERRRVEKVVEKRATDCFLNRSPTMDLSFQVSRSSAPFSVRVNMV